MIKSGKVVMAAAAAALVVLSLGACREEEQGRQLAFKKGTYLGPKDEAVPADAVKSAMDRVKRQQF